VLDGAPGAWPKFIGHWLLRSALIMPGLVIGGVRDKRIIPAALASSTFVSLFLMLFTVVERGRRGNLRGRRARGHLRGHAQRKLTADQRSHLALRAARRKRAAQRSFAKR
jgi:hypothetical protein